jgi:NAD(P)-dependent dehydrogenase (short-subunit alcohol dehydrogenase family)
MPAPSLPSSPRKFLVTGASSGIGRAVALRLAARNASMVLGGRSMERLNEVSALAVVAGAQQAVVCAGDITSARGAEELVHTTDKALGGLDAVIHCAGIGLIRGTLETTDAEFTRVMNVNTRGTFLVARESCRVMAAAKRGLFVTLPGILGRAPMRNAAAYVASKYAVTGMIKAMSLEFQRSGVRFSLLHFGGVDTPFWDEIQMAVQRDKMIPVETAVDCVVAAIDAPPHLVLSEMVMQPESHQL